MENLKKKMHITSQTLSEKISGNSGSDVGEDIHELWRKTEVVDGSFEKIIDKTKIMLRPNPAERRSPLIQTLYHKACNEAKYTQPEFKIGVALKHFGNDLSSSPYRSQYVESTEEYSASLLQLGEALQRIAERKDKFDTIIKDNFLEQLQGLQQREIKEITKKKKKVDHKRLDYDYKEARKEKFSLRELSEAESRFSDSKKSFFDCSVEFFENKTEYIKQLHIFAEALRDYHKYSYLILNTVTDSLWNTIEKENEAREQQMDALRTQMNTTVASEVKSATREEGIHSGKQQIISQEEEKKNVTNCQPAIISQSNSTETNAYKIKTQKKSTNEIRVNSGVNNVQETTTENESKPIEIKEGRTVLNLYVNVDMAETSEVMENSTYTNIDYTDAKEPVMANDAVPKSTTSPRCKALYDFKPEHTNELEFHRGDKINLLRKVDDNWLDGTCKGRRGFFPSSYVEILVPL